MPDSKCPQHARHWFAGAAKCWRCGAESPESIALHKRRARTDYCEGTGQIGYGHRLYPSGQAAHSKYRPCEGVGCHTAEPAATQPEEATQ